MVIAGQRVKRKKRTEGKKKEDEGLVRESGTQGLGTVEAESQTVRDEHHRPPSGFPGSERRNIG